MGQAMGSVIVESAKVMAKGQITLPKDIRDKLNVGAGDRVVLIWDGDRLVMLNPAVYAMQTLQRHMEDDAGRVGFETEEDVSDFITAMRHEGHRE